MGRGGSGGRPLPPRPPRPPEGSLNSAAARSSSDGFCSFVHCFGGFERLARLQLALRLDGRFGLGPPPRPPPSRPPWAAADAWAARRLHRATGSAASRPRRRWEPRAHPSASASRAPMRARHQRHLLGFERREVAAHEDVLLLEHAHEQLRGDPKFSRQIVKSASRHSLLQKDPTNPRANAASATPTACTGGAPTPPPTAPPPDPPAPAPAGPAPGAPTFSRVRRLASAASTTHDKGVPLQLRPHPRSPR